MIGLISKWLIVKVVQQVLALARKMLNGSARNEILDGAYSRHAFHDVGVPRWFYEDEQRHMKWVTAPQLS